MSTTISQKVHILQHPLVQHKLSLLRDVSTNKKLFTELVHELTIMLAYEATRHLPLTLSTIKTPLETIESPMLAGKEPVIVPILRAGLAMVNGLSTLLPAAPVGHIGLFRNEKTLAPQQYYFKIPPHSQDCHYFVCDPMLATGGSALAAIELLKKEGIKNITFLCLVAAPVGLERLATAHPEMNIYCASLDRELNAHGYILPGLGDAGDRLFGTK